MSRREFEIACSWADHALDHIYAGNDKEYAYCLGLVQQFIGQSAKIAVYRFTRATNIPNSKGYFVACDKRDMQPYMCDTILSDDLNDAYELAFHNAESYGEPYALINGESFEFDMHSAKG